jgi:hypothetical protein
MGLAVFMLKIDDYLWQFVFCLADFTAHPEAGQPAQNVFCRFLLGFTALYTPHIM